MYVYTNMIICARFRLKQMNTEQRDEIGVAIESWFWERVELMAW